MFLLIQKKQYVVFILFSVCVFLYSFEEKESRNIIYSNGNGSIEEVICKEAFKPGNEESIEFLKAKFLLQCPMKSIVKERCSYLSYFSLKKEHPCDKFDKQGFLIFFKNNIHRIDEFAVNKRTLVYRNGIVFLELELSGTQNKIVWYDGHDEDIALLSFKYQYRSLNCKPKSETGVYDIDSPYVIYGYSAKKKKIPYFLYFLSKEERRKQIGLCPNDTEKDVQDLVFATASSFFASRYFILARSYLVPLGSCFGLWLTTSKEKRVYVNWGIAATFACLDLDRMGRGLPSFVSTSSLLLSYLHKRFIIPYKRFIIPYLLV